MGVPISNVTRRVVYTASGTGPYSFTFEILANTDIAVYKDDTLLTLTTDYSVTINSNGTGSVALVSAPTGADQIAIVGNRAIKRTTDFVTGGDFFANTVNDELDQQTIFAQQNAEGIQRSLQAPQTDPTNINMILPRATDRAGKSLAFDSQGNPTLGDTLGTNRGNWASGVLYYERDIVKDTTNNNVYQCLTQHTSTGSLPISSNTDVAKWFKMVDAAAAAASEAAAAASATAAASSASSASISASAASSSASSASTSASTATTQASNASSSASAASSSASAASTSATNAATSETNASASAAAAAASAAAGMYSSVQDKSANYSVIAADAGDLIRVTTTSGARTITLPTIGTTGITDGFKIAIAKWTSDGNAVTISRAGSDTINGATSYTIGVQYSSATFVADAETNTWFAAASGLGVSNMVVDVFSGNNSTTAFTLAGDPGSKNNTLVTIAGVYQAKSTYSVSGTTLTFSTAPPTGTSNIEVVWNAPLAIGTPSDGTVTAAKMAAGAAVGNLGFTPVNKAGDTMSGDLTISKSADNSRVWLESVGGSGRKYALISNTAGSLSIYDNNAGADRIVIDSAGVVQLPSGQLKFPATQSASSDANTLDDYEEGTWTPSDGSGAGLSFTNTSGNCIYTKIGRTVIAAFRVTYPTTANGSFAYIGGLPFATANTTVNIHPVAFAEQSYSAGASGNISTNDTKFLILTVSGGSVAIATNANVSGKDFRGVAIYQV